MANMGGPVNANTPNHAANPNSDPSEYVKRLNTYIYDYFVRNGHYDCARVMIKDSLPIGLHSKSSPGQRQANGLDDMDLENDVNRPPDLPLTDLPAAGGHFLEDWWFQFWDVFYSRRSGQGKPSTITYLSHQRVLQKARSGMTADASGQRNFSMTNGQPADLKKMAMQNNGNMNPQALAAMRARHQQQQMQAGQMERSASQMDAHSGSPGSGGAPSPKRPRVDGNMQPINQQRPGQPGQMPTQGMPQNAMAALQAGAQGSPMPQGGMDVMGLDNGMRQNMMQNNAAANMNAQQAGANNNGSHALQDYQMQLMLLEQQNKRRLQMARNDQDTMNNHTGVPAANGQFAPNMSPSGRVASPNPNDMSRGTPKMNNGPSPNGLAGRGSPAPYNDPNMLNALAAQRNQMMVIANGQLIPRSSPMGQAQMSQAQMEMLRAQAAGQMMPNGSFQGAPGMPPGMMPGQPGPQPGQGPPNMTPRQGNMAPPPAPQPNAAGTQPSSPQPAAPPTPSQSAKGKPAAKKDTKAGKNFGQNQAAAMANGAIPNGQVNGAPNMQPGVMQPGQQDMGVAPFNMDDSGQFMINDFTMDSNHDVLDNFDFDAFLQNTDNDGGMAGFDYDFGGVEAGEGLGP
ncbi:hypothetical protein AMS68_003562 [Peltaster fructicola]|uniref:Uncharacterized protein n=1 Tax=Peltaster fructicola TaxID=286661 RepID=A0A6H0XTS4_9PEZI|nr:hypothetical protein AMS68_003562 [Peltaster fructicola]